MSALPAPVRDAIRDRRVHLGLTQEEAAAAGDVSPAAWRGIEKGRSAGSNLVRSGMCKALGWTTDSIDRLEHGDVVLLAPHHRSAADEGSGIGAALNDFRQEITRLSAELAALRILLVDRLSADEPDRRRL